MIYIYLLEKSMSKYLMLFNIYCGDGSGWLYRLLQDFLFILCVLYIILWTI